MLQAIREHAQGWISWVLVIIVAATFVFWGVGNYINVAGDARYAAKVNGEGIAQSDVDRLVERMRANHTGTDDKQLQKQALDQLIDSKLLFQTAKAAGFWIGDQQLNAMIVGIAPFQENGKFSPLLYEQRLRSIGFTDATFKDSLRDDLIVGQLQNGLSASLTISSQELDKVRALINEARDIQLLDIDSELFRKSINVSEDEIKKSYETSKAAYMTPEMVSIDYVTLNTSDFLPNITVTDDEAKNYYDKNTAEFIVPRQVRVAHILISAPKVKSEEASKKVEQQAEALLKKIQSGASFEAMAKQYSADPASAKVGGDIGWLTKGDMDPEFETAAFALKNKNEVAPALVKSQYGFHILKMLDQKPSRTQSFAEAKPLILSKIKEEKAAELKAEKLEKIAALAYEHSDSLQPIVDDLKLEQKTTPPFGRDGGPEIASKPKVTQAAFSEDVLQEGHNSDIIDIDENTSVVIRLNKHYPPEQKPFHLVEPELRKNLETSALLTLAQQQSDKWIESLKANKSISDDLKARKLVWQNKTLTREDNETDKSLVAAVFKAPKFKAGSPVSYQSVALANAHMAIFSVTKISDAGSKDPKTITAEKKQFRDGLKRTESDIEFSAILNAAKSKSEIEYLTH